MGRGGTEVARQPLTGLLTDDDFASIESSRSEEGRGVYLNLRKDLRLCAARQRRCLDHDPLLARLLGLELPVTALQCSGSTWVRLADPCSVPLRLEPQGQQAVWFSLPVRPASRC